MTTSITQGVNDMNTYKSMEEMKIIFESSGLEQDMNLAQFCEKYFPADYAAHLEMEKSYDEYLAQIADDGLGEWEMGLPEVAPLVNCSQCNHLCEDDYTMVYVVCTDCGGTCEVADIEAASHINVVKQVEEVVMNTVKPVVVLPVLDWELGLNGVVSQLRINREGYKMRVTFKAPMWLFKELKHNVRECTKVYEHKYLSFNGLPTIEFRVTPKTIGDTVLTCHYVSENIEETIELVNEFLDLMYFKRARTNYWEHIEKDPMMFSHDNKKMFYFDPEWIEMTSEFREWVKLANAYDYTYAYSDDLSVYRRGEAQRKVLWDTAYKIDSNKCRMYYNWIMGRADGNPDNTNFGLRIHDSYGNKKEAFAMFGLVG